MAWILNFATKAYQRLAGEAALASEGPDSPRSSVLATTGWQPGQLVQLARLQRQRQLNGQVATVVRQDLEKGKWVVRLEDAKEVGVGCYSIFCKWMRRYM